MKRATSTRKGSTYLKGTEFLSCSSSILATARILLLLQFLSLLLVNRGRIVDEADFYPELYIDTHPSIVDAEDM